MVTGQSKLYFLLLEACQHEIKTNYSRQRFFFFLTEFQQTSDPDTGLNGILPGQQGKLFYTFKTLMLRL